MSGFLYKCSLILGAFFSFSSSMMCRVDGMVEQWGVAEHVRGLAHAANSFIRIVEKCHSIF